MKDRIKELRKTLGLTQAHFGTRIGVKGNTVTNYETGLRTPTDAVIHSICREFNVNEEWLRNGNGEIFIELTRDEQIEAFVGDALRDESDSFKKKFIAMLAALDESDWEILQKMVEKIRG